MRGIIPDQIKYEELEAAVCSWKRREQEGMTKEQAMTVLGLTRTDGKRRPKTLAEYTEDDLLEAFRTECKVVGKSTRQDRVPGGR